MKKFIKKIVFLTLSLAVIGSLIIVGLGYLEYKSSISKLSIDESIQSQFNKNNFTSYEDINPIFIEAVIATEDSRYWSRESVIDFEALGRAMARNIMNFKLLEGGSTIPQQVGKNLYFDHSASLVRKVSEWFVARDVLNKYNKKEIIAIYVNMNYYGDGYYGIYEASRGYFDKTPLELTDGQATLLAGIPQAPSVYQLSTNFEGAKKRQQHVLNRMLSVGYIDEKQLESIFAENVYGD